MLNSKNVKKLVISLVLVGILFILKDLKTAKAATYSWPITGSNASETYMDYRYYGSNKTGPAVDGKYGRNYVVNNKLWPNEQPYSAVSESHYGMDITGINGHSYQVASIVNGTVVATSANRVTNPSINYIDRNQRRTTAGLKDGGGYGNYVIIQETTTGRCFLYAHLKGGSIKVSKGNKVSVGTAIATMGSSGDSGHMHLHFEIRTSKSATVNENKYGNHYLVSTSNATTLDPTKYIGSSYAENVYKGYSDKKSVKITDSECKIYVKYLYKKALSREASDSEAQAWVNRYKMTGSIAEVTKGIVLSKEANLSSLNNTNFVTKCYQIVLMRTSYTSSEMQGHITKLNNGVWNRKDFINMLCASNEFVNTRLPNLIKSSSGSTSTTVTIQGLASKDKLKSLGDLNADGKITSVDASICLSIASNIAAGKKIDSYIIKYADIDNDGKVTSKDATVILKYYSDSFAGKINCNKISLSQYVGR